MLAKSLHPCCRNPLIYISSCVSGLCKNLTAEKVIKAAKGAGIGLCCGWFFAGFTTSIGVATGWTSNADRLVMRVTLSPIIPCALIKAALDKGSKKPEDDLIVHYIEASLISSIGITALSYGGFYQFENLVPFVEYKV